MAHGVSWIVNILGIETSCDEAGLALIRSDGELMAQALISHIDACVPHGGVLPEVVAREHMRVLPNLMSFMMKKYDLQWSDIHAVAVTAGPGLISSLLVGCAYARGISRALQCPLYGVNHLQAHVLVARMGHPVQYPFVALLISGGHTILYRVEAPHVFHILGQTYDDAVGEAFDKTARLLGMPYPGGAHIEKMAKNGCHTIDFPKPLINRDNLDFSFSGLKASVARYVEKTGDVSACRDDIAHSFQESVAAVLADKVCKALRQYSDVRHVVMTGGVAANKRLRQSVQDALPGDVELFCPPPSLCTDNGVMIAWAAHELQKYGVMPEGYDVIARPTMPL